MAQTEGVRVEVRSFYLPDRSDPAREIYFFGYRVRIANEGPAPVRLVSRHWIVTDGAGRVEHIRGPGVVGEQPRLEPGEALEYTSFCPLPSPFGAMRGSYQMVRDDGSWFDAVIDSFSLEMPRSLN